VGSVSVTLGATITTTPLCAYYFESVSLISILANLLTLSAVSFVFYGIMAACVLSAVWLPLGKGVAWLISWAIRYVIGAAKLLSKVPLAAVYTNSAYILIWLILCYVLLAVFLRSKKKYPGVLGACMGAVLCIAVAASWAEPRLDDFRLTALPVGQGQCLLLQSGSQVYVIDCGGDNPEETADEAAAALLSQGIRRLDGLILTHYDEDHAGGAQYLLNRIRVDALFLPDGTFKPRKLIHNDTVFDITRIVQIRPYCPRVVRCIAPIEYTVIIDNVERRIYYENDTNTWFSVKEVCE
jgi:competence protein ComEC